MKRFVHVFETPCIWLRVGIWITKLYVTKIHIYIYICVCVCKSLCPCMCNV